MMGAMLSSVGIPTVSAISLPFSVTSATAQRTRTRRDGTAQCDLSNQAGQPEFHPSSTLRLGYDGEPPETQNFARILVIGSKLFHRCGSLPSTT